ncbi:AraC family transcriptional regulator [Paenibacillus sp. FSL R7-0273]|uniref:AraC family transcriptional regulator n=1 Tax=Paenibacillus sp. FSL R7-0273 TaxID=1536772 RepID=UPI0004F64E85|nr:AraC family transcriptional regulator [Paenibacillus sp. FSL R7-0273]AIQ46320.1 AraC family transcriptional regulator [Paenibacillus sp. FSL R7-0273]OMF89432.1 AraC family transcriptional regulator [Paenibacillus sp. FSL R7-0273]
MKLNDHILLWNHVFIKIIDVRHTILAPGELPAYRLPSSAFLYVVRGAADVYLDHSRHRVERFHVLHGGKGTRLRAVPESGLEYYLLLYRATPGSANLKEITRLMEQDNPFLDQYAFVPHNPLILYEKVELLEREWGHGSGLGKLHVRALFYQFVYELLSQLYSQKVHLQKPDLVMQAVDFIREHYSSAVTLQQISGELDCSAGHLSRLFKNRMNTSPIHYLGQVRVERALELLLQTDATLQEIAEHVGYPDAHSLSRSFKKYKGLSPIRLKNELQKRKTSQDMPFPMLKSAVQQGLLPGYSDIENQFHYRPEGDLFMQGRFKLTAMTMVLCLSLLLTACSGAAGTNTNTNAAGSGNTANAVAAETAAPATAKPEAEAAAAQATRTVSTLIGDVEVPANPQRVASDQYMGQLLKLGIIPVGARSFMLKESWIADSGISAETIAGIEDLGGFPMNLEKLAYLEPDLIIGSIEKNIEDYKKIGTTVFLPYWEGESTSGPLDKFRRISEIFGKEQVAEAWITDYEAQVADARKKIEGIVKEGEKVSVISVSEGTLYVLGAKGGNYGSSTIYEMLQLPPTEKALNMEDGYENISLEVLPEYLGDHVFVYGSGSEGASEILDTSIWKALPAVQKGQVYKYGSSTGEDDEFVMEDPYSLELQLDSIVKVMLGE